MSTDYKKYKEAMNSIKTVKQLNQLLTREGFEFKRQNGSHGIYRNDPRGVSVSVKMNDVTRGTLRNILQDVFPLWNVKDINQDMPEEITGTEYHLTESMLSLCKELELNPEELTQEDYNTIVELSEAS